MEDKPVELEVLWTVIIDASEEPLLHEQIAEGRVLDGMHALITCHPEDDPLAPQRLVIWAAEEKSTNISSTKSPVK